MQIDAPPKVLNRIAICAKVLALCVASRSKETSHSPFFIPGISNVVPTPCKEFQLEI